MKIRLEGDELFYADGQTDGRMDMTKLIVNFRNFTIAPKKKIRPDKAIAQIPKEFERA